MTIPTPTAPVKLMMVTENNNNKIYSMVPDGGTIVVEWGRVGSLMQRATYPLSKWNSLYNSKVKKGYKDVTDFVKETKSNAGFKQINDIKVERLMNLLMGFSTASVKENYTIASNAVTQAQVSEAQSILDSLTGYVSNQNNGPQINKMLLELYAVIPRKMKKVQEHLVKDRIDSDEGLNQARKIIDNEQKTLDVMRGQVNMQGVTPDAGDDQKTILEILGIEVVPGDVNDEAVARSLMGPDASEFKAVYKVTHGDSQTRFINHVNGADNKTTELFWHGSRNENWISILNNSLVIRPTNAILTGAMFGNAIYAANKYRKSAGYTSLNGAYWTNGGSNRAFLGLFDFHVGKQLHIRRHDPSCYKLTADELKRRGNYDSLFAHGGADLRNDEFCFYTENQSTIKYLVEVGK
jgi:poly [ADP-ribose] polymerase 2/3/4